LCTTGHFQFARSWHCRNHRTTTRKHCICLHFGCRWASICPLNITEILWNAFRTTRTFRRRCATSWVTWRWSFIFSTWCWTRRLSRVKLIMKVIKLFANFFLLVRSHLLIAPIVTWISTAIWFHIGTI
jgi:hypothetical protein